jgi:hypothetical protein
MQSGNAMAVKGTNFGQHLCEARWILSLGPVLLERGLILIQHSFNRELGR